MYTRNPLLDHVYSLSPTQIHTVYQIPYPQACLLYHDLHSNELKQSIYEDLTHFHVIVITDSDYPVLLKEIPDPPLVLYTIGRLSLLNSQPALSVIGTRTPSYEATDKMNYIIRPIVKAGFTIVSGMAKGVDSLAHKLALKEGGKTIAVLGGGFHHIYPRENIYLYEKLTEHGLVISEYPPSVKPIRYHFPERNRIISGLSYGTVVIEATEKSGTLITVDHALEQGREVYAVPGSPFIRQTKGCHRMIQDGAKLVAQAEDIMEDFKNRPPLMLM